MTALQNPPHSARAPRTQRTVAAAGPDVDPVTAFVHRHQTALCRFLRLCGAGAHAEEVAQEAFLVAIHRGLTDADPTKAGAFLRQTAKHIWLRRKRDDRLRWSRQAELAEHLWLQHVAPAEDGGNAWLDALAVCVAQLPERSRMAVDRTYRDGLGRKELGAELGIGEHGVRSLLQRLRKNLKDCIERRLGR